MTVADVARGLTRHDAFNIRSEVIDHIHRVDKAVHAGLGGALYFCEVLAHVNLGGQVCGAEVRGRARLVLGQVVAHHGGVVRHYCLRGRAGEDEAGVEGRNAGCTSGFDNRGSV